MQTEKNNNIPRLFVIGSVVIGLVLAAFSIASGSNPLIRPDKNSYIKELQANPVQAEQLAGWIVEGKRDFRMAGFRSSEECTVQKRITPMFKCYNSSKVSDAFWVRKTFKNINMPLVVYGTNTEDSLNAAVELKHMGYDVRYLEAGFEGFVETVMAGEESPVVHYFAANDPLVKQKGQKWVVAEADEMMEEEEEEVELGDDEESEDEEEEDEEEEEGC